jgi:hypothetical protein
VADLDELVEVCERREELTGQGWGHYRAALSAAHRVLFHLGVVPSPASHWHGPESFEARVAHVAPRLRPALDLTPALMPR